MAKTSTDYTYIRTQELPYLNHIPDDGRDIVISPYYDIVAKCFCFYIQQTDGMIFVFPSDDIDGTYLAKSSSDTNTDCKIPFLETVYRYFSFSDILKASIDVEKDLINGLGSLHKYFVLLKYANENNDLSGQLMINTEIEYAFGNHRSFYDCLHKIICILLKKYRPTSPQIPDSFAKIALKSDQELELKYLFPKPLIDFYKTRKDIFLKLREIRDNIFHHGHSPDEWSWVFSDGFAFVIDDRFAQKLGGLNLWPESLLRPKRLGSTLAIFEFLVRDMFDAMNHLSNILVDFTSDPPFPLINDHQVFLRSSVSKHLVLLDKYRDEHWIDPRRVLGIEH